MFRVLGGAQADKRCRWCELPLAHGQLNPYTREDRSSLSPERRACLRTVRTRTQLPAELADTLCPPERYVSQDRAPLDASGTSYIEPCFGILAKRLLKRQNFPPLKQSSGESLYSLIKFLRGRGAKSQSNEFLKNRPLQARIRTGIKARLHYWRKSENVSIHALA